MNAIRVAIITVSDGVAARSRPDASGDAIAAWASAHAHEVVQRLVAADATHEIAAAIINSCDANAADIVLTTGGTGLTTRDVTPEATRVAIQREAPGIAEAIRAAGAAKTPATWISRGIAGTRGTSLIVNLPGSTSGVLDGLTVIDTFLEHAVQLLRGIDTDRHPVSGG